jgi:glutamyl-tRNA reductase
VIVVVGVSHKSAPLPIREALSFGGPRLAEALGLVRQQAGLAEAVILSTCNRVEIYGRGHGPEPDRELMAFLCRFHNRPPESLAGHAYVLLGDEAVRHAFRVAASLESMVVGEPQILGQVKEAYQAAESAGTLGSFLNGLKNRSLSAAKRVRTETGIGQNAVSVSSVAVELARKIFRNLKDREVLLVGAGKMTEIAARQLVRTGARATVLGGRTFARAEDLAAALGGRAAPLESLRDELAKADIVISGTGSMDVVIRREDVEAARRSGQSPLFVIDIAVPRDVDPAVGRLGGVFLYDLDDLKSVAEANMRERLKEVAGAEALVDEEVREFLAWQKSLEVTPLLVELRRRGEAIRSDEIARAKRNLGPLTPEQEQAIDGLTSAIVNKLLHAPTVQLKELASNGTSPEHVSLVKKLLGL